MTKRRLRPVLWFACALLAIDVAVRQFRDVWERHSPDEYAERVRGCAARPRDFVLLGGSPVTEGLNPAVVAGARWHGRELCDGYALGLPGGTTTDFYYALRHGCPVPPALLVYGIAPSDMNDSRNEPHGPASVLTWGDLPDALRTRPDAAEWTARKFFEGRAARAWAVYHHRHGIRLAAAALAPTGFPDAAREAGQGVAEADAIRTNAGFAPAPWFVARNYAHTKATNGLRAPFPFLDRYKTGSHVKYLDRIADWAAERGTCLVLVDMPTTADLEALYPGVVAEYRGRLAEFERRRGVTVFRATREAIGLTDADFADLIHLNACGAAKLSAWLRERLTGRSG